LKRGVKILIIVSLIVLIIALLFVCWQLFRVRAVNVKGSADAGFVRQLSGLKTGDSIFFVDRQEVLDRVEAEPWIKAVEVNIVYPDKVEITAEKREIAAYVKSGENLLAIDGECCVLKANETSAVDMPVITGLQMDVFEVGKTLGCGDKFMLGVIERLLDELNVSGLKINEIDLSMAANIVFKTQQGMCIEIGDDTNLAAKLKLASATIIELEQWGNTSGILDVSSVSNAYYREN